MTATTAERDTPRRSSSLITGPLSNVKVLEGTIACFNSAGYLVAGSTATTLRAVGRFAKTVDNSAGAAGDLTADVERGCFKFANSASADQIGLADYGKDCYIVDNQTVAKTDGSATRSIAGKVRGVDSDGVWVEF